MIVMFSFSCGSGCVKDTESLSIFIVGIYATSIFYFSRCLWALIVQKKIKVRIFVIAVVTMFIFGLGTFFLEGPGFSDQTIEKMLVLGKENSPEDFFSGEGINTDILSEEEKVIDGKTMGPYTSQKIQYGLDQENALQTETVNLSTFCTNKKGDRGIYRSWLLGLDVAKAPIKGSIWYPNGIENCPILFIIHGNHTIGVPSYEGYDYLGEYLASYGYVVVSVDENVLNELSGENDARAILLLENIKTIKTFNEEENNILYNKANFNEIGLLGHSRGGEAVATACLFNSLTKYPENGLRGFTYDFSIKSIVAIAPSVNQYMPADHPVVINNVSYLLLQGANDQDIYGYMGTTQFDNVILESGTKNFKSSLYIANANHGQFNSIWGNLDMQFPYSWWLNVENLLGQQEQQQIAKTMIKSFLDVTLKGAEENKGILSNYEEYSNLLPNTLYIQRYQAAGETMLANFEEDADVTTGTMEDVTLVAHQINSWKEEVEEYANSNFGGKRANHILSLKWEKTEVPNYILSFHEIDLRNATILFNVADADETKIEKMENMLTCYIELKDVDGNIAVADTRNYGAIYPPIPVKLGKVQYVTGESEYKIVLQDIQIPIDDFVLQGETFAKDQVVSITIKVKDRDSGMIFLDNIGYRK